MNVRSSEALIVEGGAMRGIYTTGLLDEFLEQNFNPFNFYCGVSAGALNLSAYISGVKGRNLKLYTEFATRPEFMSISRFLKGGHLLDMDWMWEMMDRYVKLDHERIAEHNFHVGITDINAAKTLFKQAKADTIENILKISSSLPFFYRGFHRLGNQPMTDGGMIDAIPVKHAIEQGAKNIMVVRSRIKNYRQNTKVSDQFLAFMFRNKPELAKILKQRSERYNQTIDLIRNPPNGVKILEVCPPNSFKTSRLDVSKKRLYKGYDLGKKSADSVIEQWQRMITSS
ncbi:MAG: putative patatin/cPLA2 family phospholipase [Crocinitomicaceae bacterium]|jgi:predicted patatin/cPLA2 family phospholipase